MFNNTVFTEADLNHVSLDIDLPMVRSLLKDLAQSILPLQYGLKIKCYYDPEYGEVPTINIVVHEILDFDDIVRVKNVFEDWSKNHYQEVIDELYPDDNFYMEYCVNLLISRVQPGSESAIDILEYSIDCGAIKRWKERHNK